MPESVLDSLTYQVISQSQANIVDSCRRGSHPWFPDPSGVDSAVLRHRFWEFRHLKV